MPNTIVQAAAEGLPSLTRRSVLAVLGALAVPPAAIAATDIVPAPTAPTREELERYYSYLWLELIALSKEMDVEMHSNTVLYRSGGRDAYYQTCDVQAPSERAKAVLAAAGYQEGRS